MAEGIATSNALHETRAMEKKFSTENIAGE